MCKFFYLRSSILQRDSPSYRYTKHFVSVLDYTLIYQVWLVQCMDQLSDAVVTPHSLTAYPYPIRSKLLKKILHENLQAWDESDHDLSSPPFPRNPFTLLRRAFRSLSCSSKHTLLRNRLIAYVFSTLCTPSVRCLLMITLLMSRIPQLYIPHHTMTERINSINLRYLLHRDLNDAQRNMEGSLRVYSHTQSLDRYSDCPINQGTGLLSRQMMWRRKWQKLIQYLLMSDYLWSQVRMPYYNREGCWDKIGAILVLLARSIMRPF